MSKPTKLTEAEKKAYLDSNGGKCPKCGCENFDGEGVEINDGEATQEVSCTECDFAWIDSYKLHDVTAKYT